MACASCKKKKGKGIGSLSSADKAELEEVAWMTVGAVGSKMAVNPLMKALFKTGGTKYSPSICKGIVAAGLWYADTKETRAMAKGAAAVALMEALDAWNPDIFKASKYKADAATDSANPPVQNGGLGRIHGSVLLDLDNIQGVGSASDDRPSGRGMVLSR